MFKTKNIKKFISIVCSILTLNSVTSLSQTKVDALRFEYVDDDGYEYATATLDKPFYYITVYDEQLSKTYPENPYLMTQLTGCRRNWKEVGLRHCLEVNVLTANQKLTEEETHISNYRQKLKELFSKADESDEIALALAVGTAENLHQFPRLPWMLVLTPTHDHLETTAKMRNLASQQQMFLPKVQKDGEAYIPCIKVPKYHLDEPKLQPVAIADGRQDVKITNTDRWLKEWRQQAAIMTVGELKDWIRDNNQQLAQELGLLVYPRNQTKIKKNDSEKKTTEKSIIMEAETIPETNQPAVKPTQSEDPSAPTFNTEKQVELVTNKTAPTTATNRTQNEDYPQELHIDNSEKNNCEKPITSNILCNTKKFIKNNPKTSVGLGAAIVTLVGTIIYKIKKSFTRESPRSKTKNQVNQKYNQHVKNKI